MKTTSTPTPHPEPVVSSPEEAKKGTASWIITGVVLIVAGIAMIPTMFLAAIGGGFILGGIAVITSAILRVSKRGDV